MEQNFNPRLLKAVHKSLLHWFAANGRDLPWRRRRTPYRVWVSEIMLQQTRVETVLPYFRRFMREYPSIRRLAAASEDELRALWAGLGYYSRARNLHRACEQIVEQHGGRMPTTYNELLALPGIGPYTAAAISSLAFGQPYASVDGNLERVLARLTGYTGVARGAEPIQETAAELVALGNPGAVNEALMDLSATVCAPRNPRCDACPLAKWCVAFEQNLTDEIPRRATRKSMIQLQAKGVLLLRRKRKSWEIFISKRPPKVWLAGQWDIPWWIAGREGAPPIAAPLRAATTVKRTITRHKIEFTVQAHVASPAQAEKDVQALRHLGSAYDWAPVTDLASLPRPTRTAVQAILQTLDGSCEPAPQARRTAALHS